MKKSSLIPLAQAAAVLIAIPAMMALSRTPDADNSDNLLADTMAVELASAGITDIHISYDSLQLASVSETDADGMVIIDSEADYFVSITSITITFDSMASTASVTDGASRGWTVEPLADGSTLHLVVTATDSGSTTWRGDADNSIDIKLPADFNLCKINLDIFPELFTIANARLDSLDITTQRAVEFDNCHIGKLTLFYITGSAYQTTCVKLSKSNVGLMAFNQVGTSVSVRSDETSTVDKLIWVDSLNRYERSLNIASFTKPCELTIGGNIELIARGPLTVDNNIEFTTNNN